MIRLANDASRDPRIAALAELLHHIRPTWDRAGIRSALLTAAPSKTLPQLLRAGIDTALDATANTPAPVAHRDGNAWKKSDADDIPTPLPPPVSAVLPSTEAGDYTAGAAAARAAIQAAKKTSQEQKSPHEKEMENARDSED